MAKKRKDGTRQTSDKCESPVDLAEGFRRIDKIFQERMHEIFAKYDHAFEDDVIVDIQNLTYQTPDGPQSWDFESKVLRSPVPSKKTVLLAPEDVGSASSLTGKRNEDEEAELPALKLCSTLILSPKGKGTCSTLIFSPKGKGTCSTFIPSPEGKGTCSTFILSPKGKGACSTFILSPKGKGTCSTFILSPKEKGTCSTLILSPTGKGTYSKNDRKRNTSNDYIDSNSSNQTFFVASFLDDSFQCNTNSDSAMVTETSDVLESQNKCLADLYPGMIQCLSRLWNLPFKKKAADNIVQYYKRYAWHSKRLLGRKTRKTTYFNSDTSKSALFTVPSEETALRIPTAYNNAKTHYGFDKHMDRPKANLFQCSSQSYKASSDAVQSFTWNNKGTRMIQSGKSYKDTLNNCIVGLNKTALLNEGKKGKTPEKNLLCNVKHRTRTLDMTCILIKGETNMEPDDSFIYNMNNNSHGKSGSKVNHSINDTTIILDKTLTDQSQINMEDFRRNLRKQRMAHNRSSSDMVNCKKYAKNASGMTCTVTKKTSDSDLFGDHSPSKSISKLCYDVTSSPTCKVSNNKICKDKTITKGMGTENGMISYSKEYIEPQEIPAKSSPCDSLRYKRYQGMTCTLTRSNSFSYIPVVHTPEKSDSKRSSFMSAKPMESDPEMSSKQYVRHSTINAFTEKRRLYSGLSEEHSPCKSNKSSVLLNKTYIGQSNIKDVNSSDLNEFKMFRKTAHYLTRSNSFSAFPIVHSPGKGNYQFNANFESLYSSIVEDSTSKCNAHLSETTVLVNSSGTLRAKRPANNELSFSVLKRKKTETVPYNISYSAYNEQDTSCELSKQDTFSTSLLQSIVSSSVPSSALSYSPVSSSSLHQKFNSVSSSKCNSPQMDQRKNSRVYKKLSYK